MNFQEIANANATHDGRYYYEGVVGQGGFGVVLKAFDYKQYETVAIKIVLVEKTVMQNFLGLAPAPAKAAQKEAKLLFDLQHAHIVTILDHFKFSMTEKRSVGFAIVMEYCRGSLESYLSEPWRIDSDGYSPLIREALWYEQLARALEFLHQHNVVHRDLKPANILIDAANNFKVSDVGIAKVIHQGISFQKYLQTVAGTAPYMAPEFWDKHHTESNDVFSMGLVIFVVNERPSGNSETSSLPSRRGRCL